VLLINLKTRCVGVEGQHVGVLYRATEWLHYIVEVHRVVALRLLEDPGDVV
jgi:hypothetical protein